MTILFYGMTVVKFGDKGTFEKNSKRFFVEGLHFQISEKRWSHILGWGHAVIYRMHEPNERLENRIGHHGIDRRCHLLP